MALDRRSAGSSPLGETDHLSSPLSPHVFREASEKLVLEALRAQFRLETDAEAFRLLVEGVEDYSVFVLGPDGCVIGWNASATRMFGYRAEEIVGRPFALFYGRAGTGPESPSSDLARALATRRYQCEGVRVRKDGSSFWATAIIAAIRDDDGRHLGFATATRDMTEQLRTEQERVRLMRAEESVRRKDEFLAIMGHELRNPLAPMVTALQLIKLRGMEHNEREITILERQLKHLKHLVDDLLDVSHAMRGQVHLSPALLEIDEVVARALEDAAPGIQAKGHRLDIEVPPEGLLVNVDPERMAQVFTNLLSNAAKYTGDGGTIRVAAMGHDHEVEVTVADTGVGIPSELMPRIFELFTQGEQGLERQLGGLGIGLAIARRFVNEHGGEISAASEGPGRGSRFTVRLPRASLRTRTSEPPPPSGSRRTVPPKRILVVDDNEDFCVTFSDVLQALGHETRIAFEGRHALEIVSDFQPEIIFLDIGLPGIDGFQVVRRMRQLPACGDVAIVAVTGYALEEDRDRALQGGFSDHVPKPIDHNVLLRAIERAFPRQEHETTVNLVEGPIAPDH